MLCVDLLSDNLGFLIITHIRSEADIDRSHIANANTTMPCSGVASRLENSKTCRGSLPSSGSINSVRRRKPR